MSYQLGAGRPRFLSLAALVLAARCRPALRREVWFWGVWAACQHLSDLEPSPPWLWRYVPIVPYAQFPWRYLMLAIIPLSILPARWWRMKVSQAAG